MCEVHEFAMRCGGYVNENEVAEMSDDKNDYFLKFKMLKFFIFKMDMIFNA